MLAIQSPYSTLTRLKQAGVLERVAAGTYRFTPLEEPRVARFLEQEVVRATRGSRLSDLAALAKSRWASYFESGRLERLGPRRYRLQRRPGVRLRVRRR